MSIFYANGGQKPSKKDQVPAKKVKKSQKTRKNPFRRVYVCVLDHCSAALALAPGPIGVAKKGKKRRNETRCEKGTYTKVERRHSTTRPRPASRTTCALDERGYGYLRIERVKSAERTTASPCCGLAPCTFPFALFTGDLRPFWRKPRGGGGVSIGARDAGRRDARTLHLRPDCPLRPRVFGCGKVAHRI